MKSKILITLICAPLSAGCGITTNNEKAFEVELEEPGILEQTPTTNTEPASDDRPTVPLFLVDKDQNLVPIPRQFSEKPTVQDVLDALVLNPTTEEISTYGFLETYLPPELDPQHDKTNTKSSEILITVSDDADLNTTALLDPTSTTIIFAQIVCTLDSFQIIDVDTANEIAGVVIQDSNGPITALDTKLAPIEGPANTNDFNNCTQPTRSNNRSPAKA